MYKIAYKKPVARVFGQTPLSTGNDHSARRPFVPFTNVLSTDKGWELTVSLPGYSKDEVTIALSKNILTISGKKEVSQTKYNRREWNNENFERSFTLTDVTDYENISAEMAHGILTIMIPKKEKIVTNIHIQ